MRFLLSPQRLLRAAGFELECLRGPAYRGSPYRRAVRLTAAKGEQRWLVHVGDTRLLNRIFAVQSKIPEAARIERLLELSAAKSAAMIELIPGTVLWELEHDRPSLASVRCDLDEFVANLRSVQLVHGDIRPWNVLVEQQSGRLRFIDWGFSFFFEDRVPARAISHFKARGNGELPIDAIDRTDAERTLAVLLDPGRAEALWRHTRSAFTWRPARWPAEHGVELRAGAHVLAPR